MFSGPLYPEVAQGEAVLMCCWFFHSALGTILAALVLFGLWFRCWGPSPERVRLNLPISSSSGWFLQQNWVSRSSAILSLCSGALFLSLPSMIILSEGKLVPLWRLWCSSIVSLDD